MGQLFSHHHHSGPKPGEITDVDRAVLSLKAQRRKLEDQSTMLEKRIDHNVSVARELVSLGKKDRALLALKKKKLAEAQLTAITAWLVNVEDVLSSMELTKQQQRIFGALREGTAALKLAQSEWTVDDVEKLMDETAEAKEYQDKVADSLGTQLTETDADAAASELAALEASVLGTPEEQAAAEAASLPAAPTHEAGAATEGGTAEGELPAAPTHDVAAAAAVAVGAGAEQEGETEEAAEAEEEGRQLAPPMLAA